MSGMAIISDSAKPAAKNFRISEFYSKSANRPTEHYLPLILITAVQALRDHLGVPITVNSSYRTPEHQTLLRGLAGSKAASVSGSPHCRAIEVNGKENKALPVSYALDIANSKQVQLIREIRERGKAYHILRCLEITGIGIYDTFLHIDVRPPKFLTQGLTDEYGKLQFWDYQKKKPLPEQNKRQAIHPSP